MSRSDREEKACAGLLLLDVAVLIQEIQVRNNAFYVFEHPQASLAWQRSNVKAIPGEMITIDQCMTGLVSPKGGAMKKADNNKNKCSGSQRSSTRPSLQWYA